MRALLLTGLFAALAAPSAPSAPPAPAGKGDQCKPSERRLYSCSFGKSLGSVCASNGSLHYRFGPPGKPAIEISSDRDWSNVHRGSVRGGGGGYEEHLRFTRDGHDYLVFWGVAGQYTDAPGLRWSGIHVARAGKEIVQLDCKSRAQPVEDWHGLLQRSLPRHLESAPENEDPYFDTWF